MTVLFLLTLVAAQPAQAAVVASTEHAIDLESGPALPAISTAQLYALMEEGSPVLLIDARGPEVYAGGHLPGAINIPSDQVSALGPKLPKQTTLVVYCGGPGCPHSLIVGRWLVAHGCPSVYNYALGFPGWAQSGHPVETGSGPSKTVTRQ